MFYYLAVVTFLVTILFYSFYPRTDGIKTIDKPWAKTAVADLVVRHTSAVDAARVVSKNETTSVNESAYETWTVGAVPVGTYTSFLPMNFQIYADGFQPETYLLCVDNATGSETDTCGVHSQTAAFPYGTTDFLITYTTVNNVASLVGSYLANVAKRSLGETVFLTRYTPKEHLRTNCGFVDCSTPATGSDFDSEGTCMLNNTRYKTIRLPRQVTSARDGQLMCITRLGVAYDENRNLIYPK